MNVFTIRVSLHQASWQQYLDLAQRLASISVVDVIRADDGTWYRLPGGEYTFEGDATSSQLMAGVSQIADSVKPPSAVLISQALRRDWRGLEVVKKASAA